MVDVAGDQGLLFGRIESGIIEVLAGRHIGSGQANQFRFGILHHAAHGIIDAMEPAVHAHDGHADRTLVEDAAEVFLAACDGGFGAFRPVTSRMNTETESGPG